MRHVCAQGVSVEGRLLISDRAHLLFELHKEMDGRREEELAGAMIGTTRRGIGPAYASKVPPSPSAIEQSHIESHRERALTPRMAPSHCRPASG